jgi:hypothetical protein
MPNATTCSRSKKIEGIVEQATTCLWSTARLSEPVYHLRRGELAPRRVGAHVHRRARNTACEQLSDGAKLAGARSGDRLPVKANELSPARGDRIRGSRRRDVALHEHVVIAEHRIPAGVQPG